MEFKDYYTILGVKRDATQDEIKRAYRKLARKLHPDVSTEADAENRFKEVGEAYAVLRDPEKRVAYDQLGRNWQAGQDFRPPPNWDQGFEYHGPGYTGADAAFSDFFQSLFGHAASTDPRSARGASQHATDTHAKVLIELEDAYRGATRTLNLKHSELDASGRPFARERTLKVQIPKGIRAGQQIRLAGQGAAGPPGGKAGDLYLEVEFERHHHFHVEGRDVYLALPVAPWEAALGATITAPTPEGPVELRIPDGSAAGKKLRLKGRGIPGRPPGDLYVVLEIALPRADSAAVKAAYQELEKARPFNPRATLGV